MPTTTIEREIKLRFPDVETARAAVLETGAGPIRSRRLQEDCLLDTADDSLRRNRCVLRVRVESGKSYLTFRSSVALNDDVPSTPTPLTFKVLGDGKVLWESKPVTDRGVIQDCSVSVQDVDRLELQVACPGDYSAAHAVWLEPQLLR